MDNSTNYAAEDETPLIREIEPEVDLRKRAAYRKLNIRF
jgi:hypothetical protein